MKLIHFKQEKDFQFFCQKQKSPVTSNPLKRE